MRKHEMTNTQLAVLAQIVDRLSKAGWTESASMSGFNDGDFLPEEAVLEYAGRMDLTASYSASKGELTLVWEKGLGGPGITLVLRCLDVLGKVLDFIVETQDDVTEHNFRDQIVTLADLCPEIYADQGSQGLVRLDNKAPRRK